MFDKPFRKAPFVRVVIPLSGGIVMARHLALPASILWIMTGLLTLLIILPVIVPPRPSAAMPRLSGPRSGLQAAMFQAVFFCMGLMMGRENEVARVPETMIQGRICDEIAGGAGTFRTTLDKVYYRSGEEWMRLKGRVQVTFEGEDRCGKLLPGSFISASGRLSPYEDPVNPFEFDYGAYQRRQGIFYHLYLESSSWMPCQGYAARGLKITSKLLRLAILKLFERNIRGSDERAILYSLLLGYREELEGEVKQQFIRSGTMHILAVSGLHVGILYLLPAFLIGKIRGSITGRLTAALLLLGLLWFYALLTGLSPSVVRAVIMCSVHRMGILMGRKTGIFHVLSLTAFSMIISRPAIIFETGFQLSFAAVAGIAAFQQQLFMLLPVKGWLARRTWQLVTLSIAAQLATAPLSMFYFHQFSLVFVLSNLAVIPLATVILYLGFAFILLSSLGLCHLSGILQWLTFLLGGINRWMGNIPGAFIDNATLIPVQVFLLYLAAIIAGLFLHTRRTLLLQSLMAAAAAFLLVSGIREYRVRSHERFYVFAIPRESAISFVRGRDHTMYRGGRIRSDTLHIPYALRNFTQRHKLSTPLCLSFPEAKDTISRGPGRGGIGYRHLDRGGVQLLFTLFRDRRILILRRWPEELPEMAVGLETDILVLVDNVTCNPDLLIQLFKPGLIIADGSSHPGCHAGIEKACMRYGIPFHSTEKDGFYAY